MRTAKVDKLNSFVRESSFFGFLLHLRGCAFSRLLAHTGNALDLPVGGTACRKLTITQSLLFELQVVARRNQPDWIEIRTGPEISKLVASFWSIEMDGEKSNTDR